MSDNYDHKRQFPRIEVNCPATYKVRGKYFDTQLINISRGGVFIVSKNPEPIGTEISLQFELPGKGEISGQGMVVWSKENLADPKNGGMGVMFRSVSEESRLWLNEFLEEHQG